MSLARKRLVYFESWVDPLAIDILEADKSSRIELVELSYSDDVAASMRVMQAAHGYQISTRGDLKEPWFGNAILLQQCPQLLAITSTGSGYDMVDVDACTRAGVIVCNQTGSNANAVAEHALGLMLAVSKKIVTTDRGLRSGTAGDRFTYRPSDLRGKTVGLVGIGEIGKRVAQLCAAFGMRVLAHDPLVPYDEIKARGAEPVTLDDLIALADVLSLHCPRDSSTLRMFGSQQFSRMKSTAIFISTARGGIHDEGALYDALSCGAIAGAGLDVFDVEPPAANHPLVQLPNVVSTPHLAGLSIDALQSMASYAATQWQDIFAGRVPPRLVNPQAWPAYSLRFESAFGVAPQPLP